MANLLPKIALAAGFFCTYAVPCRAQVGTPKWNFQNRSQLEEIVHRNKDNLRESYNIILCAKRQGMIQSVIRAYEKEIPKNFLDTPPELAASFALAHELVTAPVRWDWKRDRERGLTKMTQADGVRVTFYRDRSLKALPHSSVVLLDYAVWALEQDNQAQALNLINKALLYTPNWAELHWWKAKALSRRLMAMSEKEQASQNSRYGYLILKSLDNAARLDPAFKQEILIEKAYTYPYLGRYQDAIDAFDAYIRYKPAYRQFIGEENYLTTHSEWINHAKQHGDK